MGSTLSLSTVVSFFFFLSFKCYISWTRPLMALSLGLQEDLAGSGSVDYKTCWVSLSSNFK